MKTNKTQETAHVLNDLVEPLNRHFHVPTAALIVPPLVKTPVTPNQVTFISVVFGLGAAFMFSKGTVAGMMWGAVLLEISLILDCVDGQLARAKKMASDLGRLIDGIGGYIANLSVVIGIGIGFPETRGVLTVLTPLTILRAISYDHSKQAMTTLILEGYDWVKEEQQKVQQQFQRNPSFLLKVYTGYLKLQRTIFEGKHSSTPDQNNPWSMEQRSRFYQTNRTLFLLWKWNGPDIVFFALVLGAMSGYLPSLLLPLTLVLGVQLVFMMWYHHSRIQYETTS